MPRDRAEWPFVAQKGTLDTGDDNDVDIGVLLVPSAMSSLFLFLTHYHNTLIDSCAAHTHVAALESSDAAIIAPSLSVPSRWRKHRKVVPDVRLCFVVSM